MAGCFSFKLQTNFKGLAAFQWSNTNTHCQCSLIQLLKQANKLLPEILTQTLFKQKH